LPVKLKIWLLKNVFGQKTGKRSTDELWCFNDKIRWSMMFDNTPLKIKCADKFAVREYVAERIGEKYLAKLYGVFERPEDVDFAGLPNKFILQCNASSGRQIIVEDRRQLDQRAAMRAMRRWARSVYGRNKGEMAYSLMPKKIIARELMDIRADREVLFMCFAGRVEYIRTVIYSHTLGHKKCAGERYYSREWGDAGFQKVNTPLAPSTPRPEKLDLMIGLAEKLAAGFNHVRVDFFELVNGEVRFAEMTFYNWTGGEVYEPVGADYKLGLLFRLPPRDADGFSEEGRRTLGL